MKKNFLVHGYCVPLYVSYCLYQFTDISEVFDPLKRLKLVCVSRTRGLV